MRHVGGGPSQRRSHIHDARRSARFEPSITAAREQVLTAKMPLPAFPRTKVQRHIRLILMKPTQGGTRVARSGRHFRCVDSGPSQSARIIAPLVRNEDYLFAFGAEALTVFRDKQHEPLMSATDAHALQRLLRLRSCSVHMQQVKDCCDITRTRRRRRSPSARFDRV